MAKVVAAVTFGAVARSKNQNFTMSEGKDYDGMRARTPEQLAALAKYSDRLRDYCHHGDPICAVGSTPVVVMAHLNYFEKHNDEVATWVTEKATGSSQRVSDNSILISCLTSLEPSFNLASQRPNSFLRTRRNAWSLSAQSHLSSNPEHVRQLTYSRHAHKTEPLAQSKTEPLAQFKGPIKQVQRTAGWRASAIHRSSHL
jgi:hypothetical protein